MQKVGDLVPVECRSSQIRTQQRSSRQSENLRDIHPGRRNASCDALSTKKYKCNESRYDVNGCRTRHALWDHQSMTAREAINIQKREVM